MDIKELESWLTEGLDDASAQAIRNVLAKDSVKAKAAGLKAQAEFDRIVAQQQALQSELDGSDAAPGTRAYAKWYKDNYPKIKANADAITAYEQKHGAGSFAAAVAGEAPSSGTSSTGTGLSEEAARKLFREQFEQVAPNISAIVKGAGTLVQKHMYAKRATPIDFEALDKIMAEKNLSLEMAYDVYDQPEREKDLKAKTDAEVDRRVKEELQKRGASANFPAASDYTPGALSNRPGDGKTFDRSALTRDLVNTYVTGGETPVN